MELSSQLPNLISTSFILREETPEMSTHHPLYYMESFLDLVAAAESGVFRDDSPGSAGGDKIVVISHHRITPDLVVFVNHDNTEITTAIRKSAPFMNSPATMANPSRSLSWVSGVLFKGFRSFFLLFYHSD